MGETREAHRLAAKALALAPGQPTATVALATADLAEGGFAAAEVGMRSLLADPRLSPHARGVALGVLADALDGQDHRAEAFEAWTRENAEFRALHAGQFEGPEGGRLSALVSRLIAFFQAESPASWSPAPGASAEPGLPHIFVVGFPRSGTTLAGQVLGAHPGLRTLDETPTLGQAADAWLLDPAALERLKAAPAAELEPDRERYWRAVQAAGGPAPGEAGLVDKLPLNLVALPLIGRLFPSARTVLLRRDPRDVVFSCFRRHFTVNAANFELLTLEGAARFYDQVVQLAELYAATLPIPLISLRYEALVADFEGETRALCEAIGMDWAPEMADFAAGSREARINTPSAGQVSRGLYGEGVGQWRRYQKELEPVLPVLEPWVRRFGYEP
jgi:hypothetical protein